MATKLNKLRRRKLSDAIVQDVKSRIMAEGLTPGDRLLNERELVEHYGCSKGTVREALSALEMEGLLTSRTGPGGGAYLAEAGSYEAARGLRNYLHFQNLDSQQVYQLRKIIEVEVAASAVGHLDEDMFRQLAENIDLCARPATTADAQWQQRVAELEFHNLLAASCPNPLLSFIGQFLNDLLRDLVELKNTINPERRQFGESNCHYHQLLLEAYRREDEDSVRKLMSEHMSDAEGHMRILEAEVANRFLLDFKGRGCADGFAADGVKPAAQGSR